MKLLIFPTSVLNTAVTPTKTMANMVTQLVAMNPASSTMATSQGHLTAQGQGQPHTPTHIQGQITSHIQGTQLQMQALQSNQKLLLPSTQK